MEVREVAPAYITMPSDRRAPASLFSNRILIIAMIGIIYFTLFPFRLNIHTTAPGYASPFRLGPSQKNSMSVDFFLNILLFMPFGIGLAAQFRRRRIGRFTGAGLALAAGILVSYTIEFLQIYVPMRSSGWDDIFTNSFGSLLGYLLLEFYGGNIFSSLYKWECALRDWFSPRRAAPLLLIYFAVWFAVSVHFQKQAELLNWDDQCPLIVGNDFAGTQPWSGRMQLLQIWNRALSPRSSEQITSGSSVPGTDSDLLASYNFAAQAPFADQKNYLPVLASPAGSRNMGNQSGLELNRESWLTTGTPVGALTKKIKASNQFSVRIKCAPNATLTASGLLVSIARSADAVDLSLWQEGTSLGIWFRNPISVGNASLSWYIPGVFRTQAARDILVSYDGADAVVYVDGAKVPRDFQLGPGVGLAQKFSFIRTRGLPGYVIIYATILFLPAGMLLGLFAGKFLAVTGLEKFLLSVYFLAPPIALELLLTWYGGRAFVPAKMPAAITLYLFFTVAGFLLINADRRAAESAKISQGSPSPQIPSGLQ
jgi:glycopeptide antibiotics resistance protein